MLKIDTHAHYLPRDWPDLAAKYGDARFPVIHHGDDGRHRIYKDGKFFREIWPKTWDRRSASTITPASACRCRCSAPCR
jgi:aminocarboxymuconate-semialdehyde decarboxylase